MKKLEGKHKATTLERIRNYYLSEDGSVKLSEQEHTIRNRWVTAWNFMLNEYKSDNLVVKMMVKHFAISEAQAYRDLASARLLFGDGRKATKEALRYLVTEWSKELFNLARKEKDFTGMSKALERITKANNLDKEDQDLPDPSKIQPPVQMLNISMTFIDSPFFEQIDDKAKQNILQLREKILKLINDSGMKDYLDLFTSGDTDNFLE